jgi:hypothetical protein
MGPLHPTLFSSLFSGRDSGTGGLLCDRTRRLASPQRLRERRIPPGVDHRPRVVHVRIWGAGRREGLWPMRLATSEVRTDGGSGRLGRGHDGPPATGSPGGRDGRARRSRGMVEIRSRSQPRTALIRLHHSPRDRGPTCSPARRSDVRRPATVRIAWTAASTCSRRTPMTPGWMLRMTTPTSQSGRCC